MRHSAYIILIAIFIFLYNGCKKEYKIPKAIDERAKFLGDYKGTHTWSYWGHPDLCRIDDGSQETTISVKLGETDSTLNVFGYELCPDTSGGFKTCYYRPSITLKGEHLSVLIGENRNVCG